MNPLPPATPSMGEVVHDANLPNPADVSDKEVDIKGIAACYCSAYAGPPWFQDFESSEVEFFLEEFVKKPGSLVLCTKDAQGLVQSVLIGYEGALNDIASEFYINYMKVVSKPAGKQPMPEDISEHAETLKNKVKSELEKVSANKYLYLLDIVIAPNKQGAPSAIKDTVKMIDLVLSQCESTTVLCQTLSEGPMMLTLKKAEAEIIDEFPKGSSPNHITAVIDKEKYLIRRRLKI